MLCVHHGVLLVTQSFGWQYSGCYLHWFIKTVCTFLLVHWLMICYFCMKYSNWMASWSWSTGSFFKNKTFYTCYTQQQKLNNPFSWFNSLGGLNWVCHKDNFRSYKFLFVNVMQYLVIQHLQYKIFTVYLYLYYKTCSVMFN